MRGGPPVLAVVLQIAGIVLLLTGTVALFGPWVGAIVAGFLSVAAGEYIERKS